MTKLGLFVRLEAKPGKEKEVEDFLRQGLAAVQQEPATQAWFAIRIGPTTYGIFDTFPDESPSSTSLRSGCRSLEDKSRGAVRSTACN